MRLRKHVFTSVSITLLSLSSAAGAYGAPLLFTGSREFSGGPGGVPNPALCGTPAPPNLFVSHTGGGPSNFGGFVSTESNCVNLATGNIFNGLFSYDFGDANTFFGTYVGTSAIPLPPPTGVAAVSYTYTLTGGTGIFTGASGSLLSTGTVTFGPTGTSSRVDISGTVNTVPEPMTFVLLGTGLVGIKVRKRRQDYQDAC